MKKRGSSKPANKATARPGSKTKSTTKPTAKTTTSKTTSKLTAKSASSTKSAATKSTTAKSSTRLANTLIFRSRTDSDDSFISEITLSTLKEIFETSTKQALTEEFVLTLIKQSDECVVIEQHGKPIGYYCYDKTASDRIYWGSLVLRPGKQAQGLGKKVVEHFVAEARKQGVRLIDGHVQVKNEEAYRFWMNNGFQVAGQEQNGSLPIQLQLD